MHPTHSVTAIGKYARYLTENHNDKSSLHMPFSRLAKVNGKILCIGIGDNLVAIRHQAQYLAGLLKNVSFGYGVKYRDVDGNIKLFVLNGEGCVKKLPELVPILREKGIIKDGKIGMANALIGPAKETLEIMTSLLKNKPSLNLCDDITCLWCRELERRENLLKDLENPNLFQKNFLIIRIITLINWFRLRHCMTANILMWFIGKVKKYQK
jgi:hypothetical protein